MVDEYLNKDNKIKEIEITPKIEIKTDKAMKKIINLEKNKNQLLACSHKGIYIYEYDMKELKTNLVKSLKKEKINDVILFNDNGNNNENIFLIGYTSSSEIFIMDNEFKIIKEIKCETSFWQNTLLQLNKNEVILGNNKALNIIDINKGTITLSKQTTGYINCLFKLNDGSIIRGERDGIRRYSKNTLDELPPLIEPYDDYDDNHTAEQLNYVYEFPDGKLALCYRDSHIKLGILKTG